MGPEPTPPEDIAREFNLPVEAVLESIAYCESNPPELLADYAREEALIAAVQASPNGRLSPQEIARIRRSGSYTWMMILQARFLRSFCGRQAMT